MAQGILMLWIIIPAVIYAVILAVISVFLIKIKPFADNSNIELPAVSIVVACRNEEKNIEELLNSLAGQDYPDDLFEVIIVDDNSTDATHSLAENFRGIKELRVIKNSGKGKKAALRCGVERASFPLVVTTDADCRMRPGWLRTIGTFWTNHKPAMIIGPVILFHSNRFIELFQQIEWAALQGITAGTAAAGNPVLCNGASLAFTKEIFLSNYARLENDLASGDDMFLLHSIKTDNRGKILWLPSSSAAVSTPAADNLNSLLNQRARWVSKSGRYKDPLTILIATVTFVTNISLPLVLVLFLFKQINILMLLPPVILKVIADYYFVMVSFLKFNMPVPKNFIINLILSEIIYPLYIITVALKSIGRARRW